MKIKPIDTELSKDVQEIIKYNKKLKNMLSKEMGIPKKYLKNEKK